MTESWLIDTSFLVAFFDKAQRGHAECVAVIADHDAYLIPEVVLTETAYMLYRFGNGAAYHVFLRWLPMISHRLATLTEGDLQRVRTIAEQYNYHFDFVDCCLMAIAERTGTSTICTLDRRDFSQYRPQHVGFFTLLPEKLPN